MQAKLRHKEVYDQKVFSPLLTTKTWTQSGLARGLLSFGHTNMTLVPPPCCPQNSSLILTACALSFLMVSRRVLSTQLSPTGETSYLLMTRKMIPLVFNKT